VSTDKPEAKKKPGSEVLMCNTTVGKCLVLIVSRLKSEFEDPIALSNYSKNNMMANKDSKMLCNNNKIAKSDVG